ncbi:MAG: superoxide dismutase [Verrucomicrobiales bacterium]|nr:superoxide dismutase [Verrucomicrobiales bacterium]
MKKTVAAILLAAATLVIGTYSAFTHCQVPCGIYDDPARFTQMEEHITTIEKAMTQIADLAEHAAGGEVPNVNQMVRWVNAKETHADAFSEIVTYYFMTQRIKPAAATDTAAYAKYVKEVTLLHQMLVASMKAKQTTDLQHVATLRKLVSEFKASYLK